MIGLCCHKSILHRWLAITIAATPVVLANTGSTFAQTAGADGAAEESSNGGFCFRASPRPECSSFLILEAGAAVRVLGDEIRLEDSHFGVNRPFGWYFSIAAGAAWNLSERSAVGLDGLIQGAEHARVGTRLRYRHWLGSDWNLDIGPGLLLASQQQPPGGPEREVLEFPSFTSRLAIGWKGVLNLALGVESWRWQQKTEDYSSGDVTLGLSGTAWQVYAGGELSAGGGAAGTVAIAIAAVVSVLIAVSG